MRETWSRLPARRFRFVLDASVLAGALCLAYLLRFDFAIPPSARRDLLVQLPLVAIVQYVALSRVGVYSFIWRYVGLADLRAFVAAAVVSAVPLTVLRLTLPPSWASWRVPLSIIVMDTVLAFGGVLALRVLRRILYERYERRSSHPPGPDHRVATLLIGAGRAGVIASREVLGRDDLGLNVIGFIDDDPAKAGAVVNGVKVLGTTDDIPRLVEAHGVKQVVITIARVTRNRMDRIVRICESAAVKTRIIPGLYEILDGRVEVSRIRDVDIEDLLGRDPVQLDVDSLERFIEGKVVLASGAGGSIGSELCRQVVRYRPSALLLVERAEPALFAIHRELTQRYPDLPIVPLLADIGDEDRMRSIFRSHRPHLVLHAAAHKHVPLMEANPFETFKNNVLATRLLGELAGEHQTEVFVMISTDKAVRPTSMMGASKRVAELVTQSLDARFDTRFVAVRFGNVLGSNGSVIPIFRDQIAAGGPITVTHPQMKRYFMTIPEAAQLVLQAGAMGERGEILILDMGEPIRIVDLARQMISLSGLRPDEDIDIVFSGVRPGEKLFEELETEGEHITKTRHSKIYIGQIAGCAPELLGRALDDIEGFCRQGDVAGLRQRLSTLLPESRVSEPPAPAPAVVRASVTGAAVVPGPLDCPTSVVLGRRGVAVSG